MKENTIYNLAEEIKLESGQASDNINSFRIFFLCKMRLDCFQIFSLGLYTNDILGLKICFKEDLL